MNFKKFLLLGLGVVSFSLSVVANAGTFEYNDDIQLMKPASIYDRNNALTGSSTSSYKNVSYHLSSDGSYIVGINLTSESTQIAHSATSGMVIADFTVDGKGLFILETSSDTTKVFRKNLDSGVESLIFNSASTLTDSQSVIFVQRILDSTCSDAVAQNELGCLSYDGSVGTSNSFVYVISKRNNSYGTLYGFTENSFNDTQSSLGANDGTPATSFTTFLTGDSTHNISPRSEGSVFTEQQLDSSSPGKIHLINTDSELIKVMRSIVDGITLSFEKVGTVPVSSYSALSKVGSDFYASTCNNVVKFTESGSVFSVSETFGYPSGVSSCSENFRLANIAGKLYFADFSNNWNPVVIDTTLTVYDFSNVFVSKDTIGTIPLGSDFSNISNGLYVYVDATVPAGSSYSFKIGNKVVQEEQYLSLFNTTVDDMGGNSYLISSYDVYTLTNSYGIQNATKFTVSELLTAGATITNNCLNQTLNVNSATSYASTLVNASLSDSINTEVLDSYMMQDSFMCGGDGMLLSVPVRWYDSVLVDNSKLDGKTKINVAGNIGYFSNLNDIWFEVSFDEGTTNGTEPIVINKVILSTEPFGCANQPVNEHAVFTIGNPTNIGVSWSKNDTPGSCTFSCKDGYSGNSCEIAPFCTSQPDIPNATFNNTTAETSNQNWVKDAPSCGYICNDGYSGNDCNTIVSSESNTIELSTFKNKGFSINVNDSKSSNQAKISGAGFVDIVYSGSEILESSSTRMLESADLEKMNRVLDTVEKNKDTIKAPRVQMISDSQNKVSLFSIPVESYNNILPIIDFIETMLSGNSISANGEDSYTKFVDMENRVIIYYKVQ